jgi:Uma2 family endonuclease
MVEQRLRAGSPATEEDVLRLGEQGERFELVGGRLIEMSPTTPKHGEVEGWAAHVLYGHVYPRGLGMVMTGEVLFRLAPGLSRAADVAFVRRDRIPPVTTLQRFFDGAPDLAVEVISPSDREGDTRRKVDDYLANGIGAVLLMYPTDHSVVLWRESRRVMLHAEDQLDLDPVVPGFRVRVRELFPPEQRES